MTPEQRPPKKHKHQRVTIQAVQACRVNKTNTTEAEGRLCGKIKGKLICHSHYIVAEEKSTTDVNLIGFTIFHSVHERKETQLTTPSECWLRIYK
jgi:hypothetical protein